MNTHLTLAAILMLSGLNSNAQSLKPTLKSSIQFHQLLKETLGAKSNEADQLHMILPADLFSSLNDARTIGDAMKLAQSSTLETLKQQSTRFKDDVDASRADTLLSKKPLTIVIVPGIFSEFIKTRAFASVFAKPSSYSASFKKIADDAAARKQPAAFDQSLNGTTLKQAQTPLADLLSVGSLDDETGASLVKVVLFNTPLLSLESVADQDVQAAIFTRRLEKYVALTGAQNIALVGYSRGLATALSMVSNGVKNKARIFRNVKAVVSYGGVVFGSTLADPLADPYSVLAQGVVALRNLRSSLQIPDASAGTSLDKIASTAKIVADNQVAWLKFVATAATLATKPATDSDSPNSSDLEADPTTIDPTQVLAMISTAFRQLGLDNPVKDYALNIVRFQALIDANLKAINQLRTDFRLQWWQTHTVPTKGLTYYSLTAAMADPARSAFEKSVFFSPVSYSQSYDDKTLLQNHRDYTKGSGLTLNDSQVGVPQAMFLPEVIERLNPRQSPMKIENLGVVSSQHWGLALEVVSPMKDHRLNPFPRIAVLKALAAQIASEL